VESLLASDPSSSALLGAPMREAAEMLASQQGQSQHQLCRVGCVAKTILSAEPNESPISSVDYLALNPRISRMN